MAKQKETKKFEFSKIGSIMDDISKKIPIVIEKDIKEKTFISTGCYLLDAALSTRMLDGGIQDGRIFGLIGESGSGKSFIAYSTAHAAQKKGYSVIYIDTEFSIDLEGVTKFGIDISPEKFRLIRSNKVEDINIFLTKLLDELKEAKMGGYEIPKLLLVIDSIGMMSSNKEKEDLLSGNIKQDMTRAKGLNALFRSISSDLGYLNIPSIVCNHSYLEIGSMYPKEISKGGMGLVYAASVLGFMSKSKLKEADDMDDMDLGASGITVSFKTQKNRLAKPKKIKFDISFVNGLNPYSGLDAFCRPEYFDQIGIAKGKEEVDKETGELIFKPGGNRWYVRHLGKTVSAKKLFKPDVFTQEVLEKMAPIVNDYFRFKSIDEIEESERKFNEIINDDDETNGFTDASDANDIFE
ncbi:MAG: DNA recombination/repair protein RecA [Candidatus Muirbacterium halophilum]|nr:DNA recombination/repair protein RecA [Candidatus Muirbacterium halophilum]